MDSRISLVESELHQGVSQGFADRLAVDAVQYTINRLCSGPDEELVVANLKIIGTFNEIAMDVSAKIRHEFNQLLYKNMNAPTALMLAEELLHMSGYTSREDMRKVLRIIARIIESEASH